MVTAVRPARPGVVTFVGVVMLIQAFLAAVAGVALIAYRNDSHVLDSVGGTPDELLASGLLELVVAGVIALVALAVLGGMNWARWLVAIVEAFRMGSAVWLMFLHHQGGFLWSGTITLAIGIFVIWALFGSERSEEFYSGQR